MSAQISQLLKLGSQTYEDTKQFSCAVEEALFRLQAHRDRALKYKMEEVQITVVDELYVEQNAEGHVDKQIARVRLFFLGFISGRYRRCCSFILLQLVFFFSQDILYFYILLNLRLVSCDLYFSIPIWKTSERNWKFLTGMPDVELGINDMWRQGKEVVGRHDIIPVVTEEWIRLEKVEFHACVQEDEYEKSRIIKYVENRITLL